MKLIDVFDKIADESLEEGFKFKFKDEYWVYDGEVIRTEEAEYHSADVKDYLYIFEVIDFCDLNDEIKTKEACLYTSTLKPDCSKLNEDSYTIGSYIRDGYVSVLPEKESTKLDCSTYNKKPYACPVCFGRGRVASGFYSSTGNTWVTSTIVPEPCRSCGGTGVIWHD